MIESEIVAATRPLVEAFEALEVEYRIGGSIASSLFGVARSTLDVDLVADLKAAHVVPLVGRLEGAYYVDDAMIREAIARRACFNVVHLDSMVKLDVFVLRTAPFDRAAFARSVPGLLEGTADARTFLFSTPEDTILHKLAWYREGHGISERQWGDVLGVLKVQGAALDVAYLAHWAAGLGLADLLERATREAGP
jgi:hypothetical protein